MFFPNTIVFTFLQVPPDNFLNTIDHGPNFRPTLCFQQYLHIIGLASLSSPQIFAASISFTFPTAGPCCVRIL